MTTLDEIKARDADIHYCKTCGNRVYGVDDPDERHNITVEECDAYLARDNNTAILAGKKPREVDLETGHLCWNPQDHHPFIEGPIPDYNDGEADRRWLLERLDNCEELAGFKQ